MRFAVVDSYRNISVADVNHDEIKTEVELKAMPRPLANSSHPQPNCSIASKNIFLDSDTATTTATAAAAAAATTATTSTAAGKCSSILIWVQDTLLQIEPEIEIERPLDAICGVS